MTDDTIELPERELFELYKILADATTAAQCGDPNSCAKHAATAKDRVKELRDEYSDE